MNTFIFGLDGASPDLIDEWIRQGHLPHLKKIKRDGVYGKLESTFPPITGPAWASFQTGVNPGKHGVYNWLDLSESYRGKAVSRKSIKTRTVWNHISHQGGKVGLVSLPLTFPPEKVNGFVVPGFLSPDDVETRTYPEPLEEALFNEVSDFEFTPPYFNPSLSAQSWVKKLKSSIRSRGDAAKFLYKNFLSEDSSAFMVHFYSTDTVQHKLWDYDQDNWNPKLEIFKETDRQIGKLMEVAPADSTFLAISDHGFGPIDSIFNVNNWLQQQGYLDFQKNTISTLKRKLSSVGLTQEQLKPLGDMIYPVARKLNLIDNFTTDPLTDGLLSRLFLSYKDVSWGDTKAYSRSDIGHIRINKKGRESQGTVDDGYMKTRREIIDKLERVKLPDTQKKMVDWVKPKEEVYKGPFVENAPDILFNPLPNNTAGYGAVMFASPNVFEVNSAFDPGHHRQNGILYASGPSITSGERDAKITDIAPTLLNLFSLPVPEQMDGEVIREIAPEEPEYHRAEGFYRRKQKRNQEEGSRDKLKNLGYL